MPFKVKLKKKKLKLSGWKKIRLCHKATLRLWYQSDSAILQGTYYDTLDSLWRQDFVGTEKLFNTCAGQVSPWHIKSLFIFTYHRQPKFLIVKGCGPLQTQTHAAVPLGKLSYMLKAPFPNPNTTQIGYSYSRCWLNNCRHCSQTRPIRFGKIFLSVWLDPCFDDHRQVFELPANCFV